MGTYVQRKVDNFTLFHSHLVRKAARHSTCEKMSEICRNPYRDTHCNSQQNRSALRFIRTPDPCRDPWLDPKAPFTDPYLIWPYDPQFFLSNLVVPILAPLPLACCLAKPAQTTPFLGAKSSKLAPNNLDFGTLENARSGRLYRPL